jgi:hypothetical protein
MNGDQIASSPTVTSQGAAVTPAPGVWQNQTHTTDFV